MKHTLVLYGPYANQLVKMEDADAARAITDDWAVDATSWGHHGIDSSLQDGLKVGQYDYPQSLKNFNSGNPIIPPPPAPVPILSISKAAVAVVTVAAGDIGKFSDGMIVVVQGVTGTGWTHCNGNREIDGVTGNTFQLVQTNTLAADGDAPTTLGTATPPAS